MTANVYTNSNVVVSVTCDDWECNNTLNRVTFYNESKEDSETVDIVAQFTLSNISGFKVMSEVSE